MMSIDKWQHLSFLEISRSLITLRAYDGYPTHLKDLLCNINVKLVGKYILINIEVVDTPLYYNILQVHSYMYTIQVVTLTVFLSYDVPS